MSLPITGYDIDQVYKIDDMTLYTFVYPTLFMAILGVVSWFLIMIAIFRDRHHHDPNYLLVLNLGVADLIMLITSALAAAKNASTGAYSLGLQGRKYPAAILTEKL
jgi:hypothetical protein